MRQYLNRLLSSFKMKHSFILSFSHSLTHSFASICLDKSKVYKTVQFAIAANIQMGKDVIKCTKQLYSVGNINSNQTRKCMFPAYKHKKFYLQKQIHTYTETEAEKKNNKIYNHINTSIRNIFTIWNAFKSRGKKKWTRVYIKSKCSMLYFFIFSFRIHYLMALSDSVVCANIFYFSCDTWARA